MMIKLDELGLRIKNDFITPASVSFRPPSWPPPRDWPITTNRQGKPLSFYGGPVWDLSALAGTALTLNFGDSPDNRSWNTKPIDAANADMLRLIMAWRMFGNRRGGTAATISSYFFIVRAIFVLCSREGILASDLMRYPRVFQKIHGLIRKSQFDSTLAELHRLYDARDALGFVLIDQHGLKQLAAMRPNHDPVQHAYIPSRIWIYQVNRLRECIDDYLAHREKVEECFHFCVDAYVRNCGSLEVAVSKGVDQRLRPFMESDHQNAIKNQGYEYLGPFTETLERFEIRTLIDRWVGVHAIQGLRSFSSYLSLIQDAGIMYICNFTLQRHDESSSLRADCLYWEEDPQLGRIPIICGETTKTAPDCDARWPTSPSVALAVEAMLSVAQLRMRCAAAHPKVAPTPSDQENPYLVNRSYEPWIGGGEAPGYEVRGSNFSYAEALGRYPRLFDPEQIRISEQDLSLARMLTPNLPEDKFAVGHPWPFSYHQLRRTGAVNMFASGLLSDSSIQYLMKHSSRLMPLYYGRGYTKLHLNENVEDLLISTMYEVMGRNLVEVMSDRFVSPYEGRKENIVVNLISNRDVKDLSAMAKRGAIAFRENRLGACLKSKACEYGGVESVAHCAGGDGSKPCADILYDRTKRNQLERELRELHKTNKGVLSGSPRKKAVMAEIRALKGVLDVIRNN